MKYYVIEHQKREDGEVNISEVQKNSFASGLSYYHERYSKMVMTELYTSVSIMLVDENLNVIEQATIQTQYVPPVEEPTEETVEE